VGTPENTGAAEQAPAAAAPTGSAATDSAPADSAASVWRVRGDPLVAGVPGGPLAGHRVAVKDVYAVAGQRIGAGNPDWLAEAPVEQAHAWAIGALLDAGADVAGIAQTSELAYSLSGVNRHYGMPPNPAAPGRVPGGSSNGPASAVALGLTDVGLGTDTAGSVRAPASWCGLFGLRTTHGAIPRTGMLPLAPSFDTVGWMTRDAATLARAGDVLLPADAAAVPVRRLMTAGDVTALAEEEMRASFAAACGEMAAATGLLVEEDGPLCGGRLDEWFTAFRTVQGAQAWACHGDWIGAHPGSLGPGPASRFAAGADVTAEQRAATEETVAGARATLRGRLEPGTVLLLPATGTPAPLPDRTRAERDALRAATLRMTCLASLAGLPAVVLPLLRVQDLPAGLCAVGAPGTDRALLDLAVAVTAGA
jgi:amidase